MGCRVVRKVCKTAAETKLWGFDYAGYDAETGTWGFLVRTWAPGSPYAADISIRPSIPTGLQYVSAGGQSGAIEPRWPSSVGGTVTDGSVTWTAEAIDNDSLLTTIASSAWATSDSDILESGDALVNTNGVQTATTKVSGGTAGLQYDVTNTITLADGTIEESLLLVSVE